jgi:sodium/proline symporter
MARVIIKAYMFNFMIIGFITYLAILSLIVLIAAQKTKATTATAGFMLGNRSINYWLTALSAHASDMSDWLFMAYPAVIYAGGMLQGWLAISLIIGSFLSWQFIAPRIRIETERYNCFTLSSYFSERFDDKQGMIRFVSALMSLLFLTVYIAAGLTGVGFLLKSAFDIPYAIGILIAIFFIAFYTFVGGFIAVAWIDAFQALFLLGVLVVVPLVVYGSIGGWSAIVQAAFVKQISLSLIPNSMQELTQIIFVMMTWMLGYFSMPHILAKFMGISDVKEMHKSKYIGITWQIIVLSAATAVGLIGMAYFADGLANKELIFIEMVKDIFPPIIAGFMLCAILAAAISTIDAQVLVLVSVLTEDFYKNVYHQGATTKQLFWFYRASILVVCAISYIIALPGAATIQALVKYAWVGLTCSFGPLVITSLYSNIVNKWGALAGILMGGTVSAIWEFVSTLTLYGVKVPAAIPGFISSLGAIYIVSLITSKK